MRTITLLLPLLVLAGCGTTVYRHTWVQGLLGANAVGSGQVDFTSLPSDYQDDPSGSLPTAPMLAFAGQQPLAGDERVHAGVEFGGSVTWWTDGVDVYGYAGGGGTVIILDFDNRMWLTDLFVGPYGSLMAGDKVRFYAGLGPSLAGARVEYDTVYETADGRRLSVTGIADDWSWGWYGRAGVEYAMDRANWVGVGVRYLNADFNLSEIHTKFDLSIWAIYASFTTRF